MELNQIKIDAEEFHGAMRETFNSAAARFMEFDDIFQRDDATASDVKDAIEALGSEVRALAEYTNVLGSLIRLQAKKEA